MFKAARPIAKKKAQSTKPFFFVSYSSREPHVQLFITCLWLVFGKHYDMKVTPSALESGLSQMSQVIDLIGGCRFAVVILDGLRPNVVFEYGLIVGHKRPLILFKEDKAEVDIRGFLGDPARLEISPVQLDVNSQFSDVKDQNWATWKRSDPLATIKTIWNEYTKKCPRIDGYIVIDEPKTWE